MTINRWWERPNTTGDRNFTTTRVAAKYVSMGLNHNEVIFKLFDYNKQYNKPPLMPSEIFNIANHLAKYTMTIKEGRDLWFAH